LRRFTRSTHRTFFVSRSFLSGNREDAEDIASETFVRAWNAPGGIRQSTVKAYLLAIARNCYLQGLPRRGRHSPLEGDFADPRQAPHDSAEQRAELKQVMLDLQQLPEVDRTALLLSAAEEMLATEVNSGDTRQCDSRSAPDLSGGRRMSYEQIAETLGLSLGPVKTKIHRARLKLELSGNARAGGRISGARCNVGR
jgi:RNA polymerase sigma-70 factor (ECF subfamily)